MSERREFLKLLTGGAALPAITSVDVLTATPQYVILAKADWALSEEDANDIKAAFEQHIPNVKVFVYHGLELTVLRQS